ncbi:MAG: cadherin repeat domain-containing protein, partial [Patescibacteria group bacterium]
MIQLKKIKFILFPLLLFIALLCLIPFLNIKAEQAEAIAVRILENPSHYSSLRWYESQNFQGSPQSLIVDGYDAVRNGRTVYVDVANVVDKNNDGVPDFLYTNILVLSYNQDAGAATVDIFGQLLKNFKFNTNLSDSGVCNKNISVSCLNDSDCPTGDYCGSKKAKVIRDVKRWADLGEIKARLDNYKQKYKSYPSIKAGSYVVGKTLSTWPSWQKSLGQELGMSLPIDPLNQLGACPGLDPTTCWDEKNQKFATDLAQAVLPTNSHAYAYIGDGQGKIVKYCAQIESNYSNINTFNCFKDTQTNHSPVIKDVNLVGRSMDEFVGYASVSDPDGDPVKLTVDLVNPDSNTWLSRKWQWGVGLNKFSVMPSPGTGQWRIYAARAGNVGGGSGYYKIKLTIDDGRGETNSIYSKDFDVTVEPFPMTLEKGEKTTVIGNSDSITISGTDANRDALANLHFQNASFNGTAIDQTTLSNNGFIINGMALAESFKPAQRTGVYNVNVYSLDPTIPTMRINSNITYTIINHPPVFQRLTATFSNNTTQICNPNETCSVAIDNSEAAKIKISGSDPDGHPLNYSLVDNLNGQLTIDQNSGIISGFEKLNFQKLSDQNFNISVKIKDQFCNNSSEAECSSVYSFNVSVKKYCSVNVPESMSHIESARTFTINNSGESIDTGLTLSDCSQVGSGSVDIKLVGKPNNKAIVLVSDLSKSMDANVAGIPAIDRLKSALTTNETGFLDRIYTIINGWPVENSIKIGLVD